jgi:hypothetical protein
MGRFLTIDPFKRRGEALVVALHQPPHAACGHDKTPETVRGLLRPGTSLHGGNLKRHRKPCPSVMLAEYVAIYDRVCKAIANYHAHGFDEVEAIKDPVQRLSAYTRIDLETWAVERFIRPALAKQRRRYLPDPPGRSAAARR